MLSNSWNKEGGESLSQRVLNKVKPEEPIKNKIDFAQKKLQFHLTNSMIYPERASHKRGNKRKS